MYSVSCSSPQTAGPDGEYRGIPYDALVDGAQGGGTHEIKIRESKWRVTTEGHKVLFQGYHGENQHPVLQRFTIAEASFSVGGCMVLKLVEPVVGIIAGNAQVSFERDQDCVMEGDH